MKKWPLGHLKSIKQNGSPRFPIPRGTMSDHQKISGHFDHSFHWFSAPCQPPRDPLYPVTSELTICQCANICATKHQIEKLKPLSFLQL